MIGSLEGDVVWADVDEVGLRVAGVGYAVKVPATLQEDLPVGTTGVTLFIHHHVREDTNVLYGFGSIPERRVFKALIAVSGVGPSLALNLLGTFTPARLATIVADGNVDALCEVPGVGKKTGERLIIDLRTKVRVRDYGTDDSNTGEGADEAPSSQKGDVRAALQNLGYQRAELDDVLKQAPATDDSSELLRWALQRLGAR
jgi:Holliday junction DNA helicase RuvA